MNVVSEGQKLVHPQSFRAFFTITYNRAFTRRITGLFCPYFIDVLLSDLVICLLVYIVHVNFVSR